MELTYLTEEEKLQVLVYMSEHRLSDNVLLQDKQIRFIEVFLERFIKECDYSGITSFDVGDDYRVIWINDSPIDNYYENCLTEFTERLDKYISIVEAIGKKMTIQRYVSDEQRHYQKYFYKTKDVNWECDVKDLIEFMLLDYPYYKAPGSWRPRVRNPKIKEEVEDEFTQKMERWIELLDRREIRNSRKEYYYMDLEVPTIDDGEKKIGESPYKIYLLNMYRFLRALRYMYYMRIIRTNPFIGITKDFMRHLPVNIIQFFILNNIDIGYWINLHFNQ